MTSMDLSLKMALIIPSAQKIIVMIPTAMTTAPPVIMRLPDIKEKSSISLISQPLQPMTAKATTCMRLIFIIIKHIATQQAQAILWVYKLDIKLSQHLIGVADQNTRYHTATRKSNSVHLVLQVVLSHVIDLIMNSENSSIKLN